MTDKVPRQKVFDWLKLSGFDNPPPYLWLFSGHNKPENDLLAFINGCAALYTPWAFNLFSVHVRGWMQSVVHKIQSKKLIY